MKKRTLAFTRRTIADGVTIEAGEPIAIVHSALPWDVIMAGFNRNEVMEVSAEESEEALPVVVVESEPEPEVETVEEVEAEATVEPEPELVEDDSPNLVEAGLAESLAAKLESNGINTLAELQAFVSGGGDLTDLEDIGTAFSKRILGWLESYQG